MADFSDSDLRAFLLGRLNEDAAASIEEKSIVEQAFFEEIQEIQDDLIDDFLLGSLSPEDAEHFKDRSRFWPRIEERLRMRKALIAVLNRNKQDALIAEIRKPSRKSRRPLLWLLAPALSLALAIILVQWHRHTGSRIEDAGRSPANTQPNLPAPTKPTQEAATIIFFPQHVSRGAAQTPIPSLRASGFARVTLQLELPAETSARPEPWSVIVSNAHGVALIQKNLPPQRTGNISFVAASLDTSTLAPGLYTVALTQPSLKESMTKWQLRVTQ